MLSLFGRPLKRPHDYVAVTPAASDVKGSTCQCHYCMVNMAVCTVNLFTRPMELWGTVNMAHSTVGQGDNSFF